MIGYYGRDVPADYNFLRIIKYLIYGFDHS